jgi:NTE family protein
MELIDKDLILKEIPLFTSLTEAECNLIKERSSLVEYNKGQIIYKEGQPPDAFYCVVLGRAVICTQDRHGNEVVLEYLHRGKYFGIISLLTGEPHSVTAKALNDCLLVIIKKEEFDYILKKVPQIAIDLSQTLSRRLKNKDIHQKTIFETNIISVFSSYSPAGKTIYALNLALSLKKETRKNVVILDILPKDKTHSMPQRLDIQSDCRFFDLAYNLSDTARIRDFIFPAFGGIPKRDASENYIREKDRFRIDLLCLHYKSEEEASIKSLLAIISLLVNDYNYIILDLPSLMSQFIFQTLNQSDSIHILTSPEPVDLKRTRNLIARLKTEFHFPEAKIKVIINAYKLSRLTYEEQAELLGHSIFATLPKIEFSSSDKLVLDEPNCEYAKAIRRITRQVGDCLVGLAVGVGVAYGLCHIGVLKVIEEEKIPVDIIAGSSIGALLASLWATGRSSQEILEITKEFKEPKYVWRGFVDLTFPSIGFIKGNKLYNFLKKYLGNLTFSDVKLPLKIIASDVKRKEPKVLDKGLLIDAIMASCAMPGIFKPFNFSGGMLMDGGVICPLPTEVLFKMGVRKIIAVNVTPSKDDALRQYEKIKEQIAVEAIEARKWFSLKQYFRNIFKTNIIDIIFSSIEVMQSELVEKECQLADIVLHPDTSGLSWLELNRSEDFAKRGEEETRRQLDKIWQVIND